jgi:hypothetical protein
MPEPTKFSVGDRVRHEKYGDATVEKVFDYVLWVAFDNEPTEWSGGRGNCRTVLKHQLELISRSE